MLTARQTGRVAVAQIGQLDQIQHLGDPRRDFDFRHFAHFQAKGHVVVDRHEREQQIVLKHHHHITVFRFVTHDRTPVKSDIAT